MCVWPDALRSRHSVWPHSQISFSWLCPQRSGYCCVVTTSFLIRKGQIHCLSSCITLIFRMAMNLCSVLHLPSPDVSFGQSLEGRGGLGVIFTSNTQISFFVEMDFYKRVIRKTCWQFKSLFFSFSRISPNMLHSRFGSLSICVSLHEWARVSWILPGYLLFATFVSSLWNWRRTGMIIWDVIWESIYAWGSGSKDIMQPFSPSRSPFLFPSLSVFFDGSFFFSSYFPFTMSLRSK